jgi:ABC-type lipoprotein release transport system permease subunit
VAALFLIGQAVARYTAATMADLQVLQAVGMTPRPAVASATAPPLLAAAAGATLGVAAAIVASRWMPIGAASYSEPHPGMLAYHAPVALWALALIGPLALVAANLLAAWPARRAARLRTAHILRTE